MENIQLGLLLMVVGMTTVFAILIIVINLGKGLIAFVNKYVPEEVVVKKRVQPSQPAATTADGTTVQDTVAIVSAISAVTNGAGKVVKIEKK